MKQKKTWLVVAIVLIIFGLIKFWLMKSWLAEENTIEEVACNISTGPCKLPNGAQISLVGEAKEQTPFRLELSNWPTDKLNATINMRSMDMGDQNYAFVGAGSQWVAEVTLAECSEHHTNWYVRISDGKKSYEVGMDTK